MKTVMTIFEGPDGGGKSVAMRAIANGIQGYTISMHHGPYAGEQKILGKYLNPMLTELRQLVHVFYDRSWLSEQVYGTVHRSGADRLGVGGRRMLERVALACRGVVVLAVPPYEVCEEAYLARRDEEYLNTTAALRDVWGYYAAQNFRTDLPIVRFDYTTVKIETLREMIEEARPAANGGPGVGHWKKGATLLVGERQNYDARFKYHPGLCFVAQNESRVGCSYWLAEQLEEWGVPESDLYWVNARMAGGQSTRPDFIAQLEPRRIIALGTVAEAWVRYYARIEPFVAIEHPQYHRRFRHDKPYALEMVLKNYRATKGDE